MKLRRILTSSASRTGALIALVLGLGAAAVATMPPAPTYSAEQITNQLGCSKEIPADEFAKVAGAEVDTTCSLPSGDIRILRITDYKAANRHFGQDYDYLMLGTDWYLEGGPAALTSAADSGLPVYTPGAEG